MHRSCLYPTFDCGGFAAAVKELKELYGDTKRIYTGSHHARFIDENVPLHIISRTFQGRYLLRPCPKLNRIIVGVIGRALELYGDVELFAIAVMSNHLHMLAKGPGDQIATFVGYVKREISRRWGGDPEVRWSDSMWSSRYLATALPTAESQVKCLRYILSQGVKEGLVAKPQLWPGVHCADSLLNGRKLTGWWLDSTAWKRACYDADRKGERGGKPAPVQKGAFERRYVVEFAPIPAWQHLTEAERRERVHALVTEIEEEGRVARVASRPFS